MLEIMLSSGGKGRSRPPSNTWGSLRVGPPARNQAVLASTGSKIYLFGGVNNGVNLQDLWEYTPSTDTWEKKVNGQAIRQICAVGVGNFIYVFGGYTTAVQKSLRRYDTINNVWVILTDAPVARAAGGITAIGNKLYIFGGSGTGSTNDLWCYDIVTNTWGQLASGSANRYAYGLASLGNKLYVYGGGLTAAPGGRVKDLWSYDTIDDVWTRLADGLFTYINAFLGVHGDKLYLSGARADGSLIPMSRYDPVLNTWMELSPGPSFRYDQAMTMNNGQFYMFGGYSSVSLNDFWAYTA